nr:DUF58 domain-containing protein [Microbulbifer guangxiensis]
MLDPLTLARTRDLAWLSRHLAAGVMLGAQHSQRRGAGLEFQQYRSYQPGDAINHIDWKLFARSDRYYVREAEQGSQMHVCFVLDASASMAQPSFAVPELTKLQFGKCWIATLCWLLQAQGDRCSLLVLNDVNLRRVPAGQGEAHHHHIALELQRSQAAGHWPGAAELQPLWSQFDTNCQVVLVSDFFERGQEISDFAARVHAAGRPCLPLQLLVEAEETFPFSGELRVRDPEAGDAGSRLREVDAHSQRTQYLEAFTRAQQSLAAGFAGRQSPLTSVQIERPLADAVQRFVQLHSRVA